MLKVKFLHLCLKFRSTLSVVIPRSYTNNQRKKTKIGDIKAEGVLQTQL